MYMQRRTDSTEAMSVKNAMLGVIDAGIMEVGVGRFNQSKHLTQRVR